jgi:type III secretion protein R
MGLGMNDNSFGIIVLLAFLGVLPTLAVTVTAFAKVAIVLFIVRNALGIQQLPPNIVVYALSIIVAGFVAMPAIDQAYEALRSARLGFTSFEDWEDAYRLAVAPFRSFLQRHADPEKLGWFLNSAQKIWEGSGRQPDLDEQSMAILVPAFLLTELSRAFEMGFLLYLPFMAIDIVVTTVLVALGLSQMQPTTIAIPFKLMLFVFVDGWTKLIQGLVLSYT